MNIAVRNVFRNRRRTALNVLMIAASFCSIVIFHGFSHSLVGSLEEVAINTQFGHYQVATQGYWDRDPDLRWEQKMLDTSRPEIQALADHPEVDYVSGRIFFFGLLNTRRTSLSARAQAFDPAVERRLMDNLEIVEGESFTGENPFELIVGLGLQKHISGNPGDLITLVAQTVDGAVNAIDLEFKGVFATGISEVDDSTFMLPLQAAQLLLDTDDVETLVVLLNRADVVSSVTADLKASLKSFPEATLRQWRELADLHQQVVSYYKVQNTLIEGILIVLVFLAIMNTVSMSVFERIGEIGTARAIGDRRSDILIQFVIEGFILGCLAVVIAVPIAALVATGLTSLQIPIPLPGSSLPYLVEIALLPSSFVYAGLISVFTATMGTLGPAFRASRLNIVEALRRNQ